MTLAPARVPSKAVMAQAEKFFCCRADGQWFAGSPRTADLFFFSDMVGRSCSRRLSPREKPAAEVRKTRIPWSKEGSLGVGGPPSSAVVRPWPIREKSSFRRLMVVVVSSFFRGAVRDRSRKPTALGRTVLLFPPAARSSSIICADDRLSQLTLLLWCYKPARGFRRFFSDHRALGFSVIGATLSIFAALSSIVGKPMNRWCRRAGPRRTDRGSKLGNLTRLMPQAHTCRLLLPNDESVAPHALRLHRFPSSDGEISLRESVLLGEPRGVVSFIRGARAVSWVGRAAPPANRPAPLFFKSGPTIGGGRPQAQPAVAVNGPR